VVEDRLKIFKKIMDKSTFTQLNFTEQHQKEIRRKINIKDEKDEDVLLAVMQILIKEKTGFELTAHLRARGIHKFENNEGFLYTLLHRLEHSGNLQTKWNDSGAKYYFLNNKGKRLLKKAEQKRSEQQVVFKELLEG
jgi:DNA-binding PadR family transcriptional regulator